MPKFKQYFNESISSSDKKELENYAVEIINNLVKVNNISKENFKKDVKKIQTSIDTVFMYMKFGKEHPLFKKYEKFMPKKYNEKLFQTETGNYKDSAYGSMNDAQLFTIYRKAVLNYAKKNNIDIDNKDLIK